MDSRHTANDFLFKLTVRWFGPFTVLDVNGTQATLDLPPSFGLAHRNIKISRLKIFEPRDIQLGEPNARHQPLWGHDAVTHYEINHICNSRCRKGIDDLGVELKACDESQNGWVSRASLVVDVAGLVHAFKTSPSTFKVCPSAPKRASTSVRDPPVTSQVFFHQRRGTDASVIPVNSGPPGSGT